MRAIQTSRLIAVLGGAALGAASLDAARSSLGDCAGGARRLAGRLGPARQARWPRRLRRSRLRWTGSPRGGRVELRGGTYHQRVHLVGVRGITLAPYRREHPILSGAGLTPPTGLTALVEIADSTRGDGARARA